MNNHQVVETSGGGRPNAANETRIASQIHRIPRDDRLFHHLAHRVDTVLDGEGSAMLNGPQSNTLNIVDTK
jgi:hypothetical protein